MAQYYKNCPAASDLLAAGVGIVTNDAAPAPVLSEFDKHCKQLLTDDVQEGWVSDIRKNTLSLERPRKYPKGCSNTT